MAVKGKFTVSSGRMAGSYRERSFEYEVVQWIKRDEYTPHDQKLRKRINSDQLGEAEVLYVKIEGGSIEGDEYRYLWGPFFQGEKEIENHLTDIFLYGSG
jgi:hypothetical protein